MGRGIISASILAILIMIISIFTILFTLASVSAYQVTTTDKGSTIISEVGNPAIFEFNITGGAENDFAEIYSLVNVAFEPKSAFDLPRSKTLDVKVHPSRQYLDRPGNYKIEFFVRGSLGQVSDVLTFKVVSLKDAISLVPDNLHPDDDSLHLSLQNTQNTVLNNILLTFTSDFFSYKQNVSLQPFEKLNISIPIDRSKSKSLVAGKYIMKAEVEFEGAKVKVEGMINYLEKQGTSIQESSTGFIIRKNTITKTNEGNVPITDSISVRKDVVSRLFTTYSIPPESTKRSGLSVDYTWGKSLQPNESWVVVSTTNYTFPFILLILIIVVGVLVSIYSKTHVAVSKQVSYVKTKGGEFALKVRLSVKARKHVERIQIIDRLPGMTKLYEKFGIRPDKIEAGTRRMLWNIDRLQAGEERVFSYIIYSNVNIVGRFELPSATVIYEKDGKTHEIISNRAFFLSDISSSQD